MRISLSFGAALALVGLVAGCDRAPSMPAQPAEPPSSAAEPVGTASVASVASVATASASAAAPDVTASTPPAPIQAPTPVASAPPAPHVRVENIGMHIGGGPNDAVNKAPIADSVAPHYGELRACWSKVDDVSRGGDFGVDLLIQPEGGRAKVTHPRTAIHPDAFRDCVVGVFETVDFKKPLKGLTMVSYSLRFTP